MSMKNLTGPRTAHLVLPERPSFVEIFQKTGINPPTKGMQMGLINYKICPIRFFFFIVDGHGNYRGVYRIWHLFTCIFKSLFI